LIATYGARFEHLIAEISRFGKNRSFWSEAGRHRRTHFVIMNWRSRIRIEPVTGHEALESMERVAALCAEIAADTRSLEIYRCFGGVRCSAFAAARHICDLYPIDLGVGADSVIRPFWTDLFSDSRSYFSDSHSTPG
jgi:hypothetical protein